MMALPFPILLLMTPLLGALLVMGLGSLKRACAFPIMLLSNIIVVALSYGNLAFVLFYDSIRYPLAGWPPPFGIELISDPLAAFICAVITTVTFLILWQSRPVLRRELPGRSVSFLCLSLILEVGLLGMVLTGDLFNLYVFLEIASLASYALMSVGHRQAAVSAFRYLLLGSIGGSFYLLGIGFLYVLTGSLNMADTASLLQTQSVEPVILVAMSLMTVGFALKMALFPMHRWLPDAYTYASSTATALIAPLMTKVSAYALIRLLFFVYSGSPLSREPVTDVVAWLSCAGIIVGGLMAMAQTDFKRMLAYSSIGQIAYIGLGIGMATPEGLIGALLHILNHALMKACLFMAAGGIMLKRGGMNLEDLRGLGRRMPWTGACITIAALAMVGIPPTVGFFSKWYLAWAAVQEGQWIFVTVILGGSLVSAVYLFRVIELMYTRDAASPASTQEIPWSMRIPLTALALSIVIVGLSSSWFVTEILVKAVPNV